LSTQLVAGRYEIERPLGHGAMAVVDLARDVELDRSVALKRLAENLSRDEELRARFLREGRLAARLAHPNVVRIFDVGEDDERPFIAMEYVDGETLAELVRRRGPLPAHEVAELGVQICRGLAAAHDAGLVHRDVKPQNLLLGSNRLLKLGDFGIAVGLGGTRLTMAGTVLGTAAYLAPEQARGEEVTAAADVYGVGAVLYELLTGGPPRTPTSLADLRHSTTIAPPAAAPRALARIVMRCLAADPAARPPSPAALAHELAATLPEAGTLALPGHPSQAATEIKAPSARRPKRVRPALALAALAVGAIVGGGIALVATTGGGGPVPKPAPIPRVAPVPHGSTPQEQAQNLADWLARYSAKR
jgi:eukaryotic-like serine/threonine-protein kinase